MFSRFRQALSRGYKLVFSEKYLFYTNTLTYMTLCGTGDCIQQHIEKVFINKSKKSYDFKRTGCMIMYASLAGPFNHFWYLSLDKVFVHGSIHAIVRKKVLADQLIFSPVFIVFFFTVLGFFEGQRFSETKKEIKEKALSVYVADCSLWPAAQVINFYWVPTHLRLMYINVVTLCWNTFLSYSKHKDKVDAIPKNTLNKGEPNIRGVIC